MNVDLSQLITADTKRETALTEARAAAMDGLVAWIDATTAAITGPVPADEKLSWASKETAARAVLAGDASPAEVALIAAEAGAFGEDDKALCVKIVASADAWRGVIATLTGIRRKVAAAIADAETPEAVAAVLAAVQADWAAHFPPDQGA